MAADATVATGGVGKSDIALVAATTYELDFADDCELITVEKDDNASPVYFTLDGTTPTAGAAGTWKLHGTVRCGRTAQVPSSGGTVVKLKSAGTPVVDVFRGDR